MPDQGHVERMSRTLKDAKPGRLRPDSARHGRLDNTNLTMREEADGTWQYPDKSFVYKL